MTVLSQCCLDDCINGFKDKCMNVINGRAQSSVDLQLCDAIRGCSQAKWA